MNREMRFYALLYVKDFLAAIVLGFMIEIFGMLFLEGAPLYYFDEHQILVFFLVFPPVLAVILIIWEIFVYERIGERFKRMNLRSVKRI